MWILVFLSIAHLSVYPTIFSVSRNFLLTYSILCHWSLSTPPESIRKPRFIGVFRCYGKRPVAWNRLRWECPYLELNCNFELFLPEFDIEMVYSPFSFQELTKLESRETTVSWHLVIIWLKGNGILISIHKPKFKLCIVFNTNLLSLQWF